MKQRIWITWETQRRSIELSHQFNCELFIIEHEGVFRYPKSIKRTLQILHSRKPTILFVQNPSMILAAIACTYRFFFRTTVVVDRHTTFQLNKRVRLTPGNILFRLLHHYTIRFASLTLVTNNHLADIVSNLGGRAFVLPDRLPRMEHSQQIALKGITNVMLISSFGKDEPLTEVLLAMQDASLADVCLYVSGNINKLSKAILADAPENVVFTGFLPDSEFMNLVCEVDVVMVLTTTEYCMLCGCYEAVSAMKPLITSDKMVLMNYFKGALFVDNSCAGIINGLNTVLGDLETYQKHIVELNAHLKREWGKTFNELENRLLITSEQSQED